MRPSFAEPPETRAPPRDLDVGDESSSRLREGRSRSSHTASSSGPVDGWFGRRRVPSGSPAFLTLRKTSEARHSRPGKLNGSKAFAMRTAGNTPVETESFRSGDQ